MNKTKYFLEARADFLEQLRGEIHKAKRKAKRLGLRLAIRLNGTSDIVWEVLARDIMLEHADVQFYDYTKILARLRRPLPANYDLTFSRSEENDADCVEALKLGFRVAAVFHDINDAATLFDGHEIIDGDLHDIRFLDAQGAIVALKAKGKARRDSSGFVIQGSKAA